METYLLEINLISAQGLKPPSANLRRMQPYAITWIDPACKLRTKVDRIGGENPTWNDKFLFRVTGDFLSSETSAVTIEIYSVGYLKDPLIGTVRFLIRSTLSSEVASPATGVGFGSASFSAVQVRRTSGRFQGLLNIGSMVINASDIPILSGVSAAAGYRDLMKDSTRKRRKSRRQMSIDENSCGNYGENSSDNGDFSDSNSNSSCSSTTTSSTSVLKDWNGRMRGSHERIDPSGVLCGLGFRRQDSSDSVLSEIGD